MAANIRGFTPNYAFKLINFDTPRWHTLEYTNWQQLDALLGNNGIPAVRGEWLNSTLYNEGDRVYDETDGFIYRALLDHTSSTSGTFLTERTNFPSRWSLQSLDVPFFRGNWAAATSYSVGDIVIVGSFAYYLCIISHTSPGAFVASPNWQLVFDTTATLAASAASQAAAAASAAAASSSQTAASNSATAASNSETAAAGSASTATTQASNASASASTATTQASNAATSATNSSNSAGAAATSATNSSNSATASAASAVDAANAAAGLRSTSTSSVLIGTGAKTFVTQAGKQYINGHFVTIVDVAAPSTNWMTGQITSYSGTSLQVLVSGTGGSGTLANWEIGVAGSPGVAGVIGLSSVDPVHLNSDTGPEQIAFRDRLNFMSRAGDTSTGPITISNATASTNTTTGALIVSGGVGIGGASFLGGLLTINVATYGWEHTDGTRRLTSWVGASGCFIGTRSAHSLNLFTNDSTGQLTIAVGGAVTIPGTLLVNSDITVTKTTPNLVLNNNDGGASLGSAVRFQKAGVNKWTVGNDVALSGGQDFYIFDHVAAATRLGISSTGHVTLTGDLTINKSAAVFNLTSASGTARINFSNTNGVNVAFINITDGSAWYSNSAGSAGVQMAGSANAWSAVSDERLAYKRAAIDITDKLPALDSFKLFEGVVSGRREVFAKAQNVYEMWPHVITPGDDDEDYVPTGLSDPRAWKMTYDRMGAIALAYLKQHDARLKRIEGRMQ